MACQGCVFFVWFVCFPRIVILYAYCRYAYCRYLNCRYVYCRFGIDCVTPPPLPPHHHTSPPWPPTTCVHFWCHIWALSVGCIFGILFLDGGYLLDSMFASFSIILALLFRASFSHRCLIVFGKDCGLIFNVFVDTFFLSRTQPARPSKNVCFYN